MNFNAWVATVLVSGAVCGSMAETPLAIGDYAKPVRPIGVNGQPAWNVESKFFMYAPTFGFEAVAGAVEYRFEVIDDLHVKRVFAAKSPNAALSPVWDKVPTGYVTVIVTALGGDGRELGRAGERSFWKAAPFKAGKYPKAKRSYAEAAERAFEFFIARESTQKLLQTGKPDPAYGLNAYPCKMHASTVNSMLAYAKLRPERAGTALKIAHAAADHLLSLAAPETSPLAGWPATYEDIPSAYKWPGIDGEALKRNLSTTMACYPAEAGSAFLRLYEETRERKYLEAAERIAVTFRKLIGEDGTCPLQLNLADARPLTVNRLMPIQTFVPFMRRLHKITGREEYAAIAEKGVKYMIDKAAKEWNWEGQFEDVAPSERYRNLTKHDACSLAIDLFAAYGANACRPAAAADSSTGPLELAVEILRYAEDQFVCWEVPCGKRRRGSGWMADYTSWVAPSALEQYKCYVPIDASNDKLIRTYLAMYRATKNEGCLSRARALADTLVNIQREDGSIPTFMKQSDYTRKTYVPGDWINCHLASARVLAEISETVGK